MAIGRIAALFGAMAPSVAAEGQSDAAKDELVIAAAADTQADRQFRDKDGSDAAAQIQAVIGAISEAGESAGQEGAGMAFSRSGGQYRDSVAALSHLMKNAHDTRTPLPQPLLQEAAKVVAEVETQIDAVRTAVEERLTRMAPVDQPRIRQATGDFLAEMQAAVQSLRGVLGNQPGITEPHRPPQPTPPPDLL